MLFLLFTVAKKRYAIQTEQVIEVLPNLTSNRLDLAEAPFIAGIINYHGSNLPVIDLCQLLNDTPCPNLLSSRIILINSPFPEKNMEIIALLAEKVTATIKITETVENQSNTQEFKDFVESELSQPNKAIDLFAPLAVLPANLNQLLNNL